MDISNSNYYKSVFDGNVTTSDLLVDKSTNELSVIQAAPIYDANNKIIGAITGRSNADYLSGLVADITYGNSGGYAYLINEERTIVADKDIEKVYNGFNIIDEGEKDPQYKEIADLTKKMLESESGVEEFSLNGERYYTAYEKVPNSPWTLVLQVEESSVLSQTHKLRNNLIKLALVIVVVFIIMTYLVGDGYTKPILKLVDYSSKLSVYDLKETIDEKVLGRSDEVGLLAQSLDTVRKNVLNRVGEMSESAEVLAATAEETSVIIEENNMTSEEIARSIEEVAIGATRQAEPVELSREEVINLEGYMNESIKVINEFNNSKQQLNHLVE